MNFRLKLSRGRVLSPLLGVAVLAAALLVVPALTSVASADTDPAVGTPATVSADALPTVQINGVAWAQVVVGNTVYVTGSFTSARPAGVAAGTSETPRSNLLAYDITTGNLITSFNHTLNAQGLSIAASADGSRLYLGGDFTTVDGQARSHVAAIDLGTNTLSAAFQPVISQTVNAIAVTSSTVYIGGNFGKAATKTRNELAAFTPGGVLLPWAPSADAQVMSLIVSPNGSKVIFGGKFKNVNGLSALGIAAVDSTSGASVPWATNLTLQDSGAGDWISSLSTDGTKVYGTGVQSGGGNSVGNFEGNFAMDPETGAVLWANDCHGDSYSTTIVGQVLYAVSHTHDCTAIGGFPDYFPPNKWQHATAYTTNATGMNAGPDNYGWDYSAVPDTTLLDWFPNIPAGTYTGQGQAGWSIVSNSNYVAIGGEFPKVNNVAQQGLVRFAVKAIAPNKTGPEFNQLVAPTVSAVGATAKVTWQATWDRDNENLTYDVLRDGGTTPIYTTTARSWFWKRPIFTFTDTTVAPNSTHTYKIRATDSSGNKLGSPVSTAVTVGVAPAPSSSDLALAGTATQSSTYPGGDASHAIDGNTDGNWANASVTHTLGDTNAWWQVDLKSSQLITTINLFNRTDCCSDRLTDYWVFSSNTPFNPMLTPDQQALQPGVWSSHQLGMAGTPTTLGVPAGTTARYVMVQLSGTNNLSLAEVQVLGTPAVDLALNRPAWTSSVYASDVTPDRAVDGVTDGVFGDNSVTHTSGELNGWWQTDLQASQSIGSVSIWNRTDCCSDRLTDYWVFVSNTPFNTDLTPAVQAAQAGVWSSHQTTAPSPNSVIPLPAGSTGRYLLVVQSIATPLSLAEVQVYAP